jgi:hypothetical protein
MLRLQSLLAAIGARVTPLPLIFGVLIFGVLIFGVCDGGRSDSFRHVHLTNLCPSWQCVR